MVNSGDIVKSKKTGKRFVVTSSIISDNGASGIKQISVIPESSYSEYIQNKYVDGYFGQIFEGMSPWKMPARDLEPTGEIYKKYKDADKAQDHWSSMQWEDDGGPAI